MSSIAFITRTPAQAAVLKYVVEHGFIDPEGNAGPFASNSRLQGLQHLKAENITYSDQAPWGPQGFAVMQANWQTFFAAYTKESVPAVKQQIVQYAQSIGVHLLTTEIVEIFHWFSAACSGRLTEDGQRIVAGVTGVRLAATPKAQLVASTVGGIATRPVLQQAVMPRNVAPVVAASPAMIAELNSLKAENARLAQSVKQLEEIIRQNTETMIGYGIPEEEIKSITQDQPQEIPEVKAEAQKSETPAEQPNVEVDSLMGE